MFFLPPWACMALYCLPHACLLMMAIDLEDLLDPTLAPTFDSPGLMSVGAECGGMPRTLYDLRPMGNATMVTFTF